MQMRGLRLLAALTVASVLSGTAMVQGSATPASASEWPTWDEVREARANVESAKAEVKRIEGMVAELQGGVEAAQAVAAEANDIYAAADSAFQEAHLEAQALQQEADEATAKAERSRSLAGMLVAQSSRMVGGDISATALADAENVTDLLQMLSRADQLTVQTDAIYERALQERNAAQAATEEAEAAKVIREKARNVASEAYIEAQNAAEEAMIAFAHAEERAAEAQVQLAVLSDQSKDIDAAYQEYQDSLVAAQPGAGAAAVTTPGAVVNGWTWPSSGTVTSYFGYRPKPTPTSPAFHYGIDVANGCGVPIYAASGGTVETVGYSPSGYGNYVRIDHGGGVTTQYAHMQNGGVKVAFGESVAPGQLVGYAGATGNVTGCHLHFEVRLDDNVTDPLAYVRGKGVPVG